MVGIPVLEGWILLVVVWVAVILARAELGLVGIRRLWLRLSKDRLRSSHKVGGNPRLLRWTTRL